MKKRLPNKPVKFIVPIVAIGLVYIPDLNHDKIGKLANNSFHNPEHPQDVIPQNDNDGVNRDKRTAVMTGIPKADIFTESDANEYLG